MPLRPSSIVVPVLVLLVAMLSVQAGASLAKQLFPAVGASGATAFRLVFASLIMALLLRPWKARHTSGSLRPLLLYGVVLGAMNLMFYHSLRTIPLGIAVALEFTGPLALAVFSSRRRLDFLWIVLAALGLWLLLPLDTAQTRLDPVGMALALGAGVCWALYIVFGQRVSGSYGMQGAALGTMIAALCIAPIGIAQAGSTLLDLNLLPLALGMALLSSAIPYSLEMIALARLPAQTFSILMSVEPAIGAISGLLFLGERLTPMQWLAMVCIMLASIGCAITATPRKPVAPTLE